MTKQEFERELSNYECERFPTIEEYDLIEKVL